MLLSAAGLLVGLGNYAFQGLMGRQLERAEYGYLNSTLSFIGLLGLPLTIASTAITHYLAHFRASGEEARLQGLLDGCKRLLFRVTIGGCVLAIVAVKPLSDFFNFPRGSLMLTALFCVLAGLWGAYGAGLCQGLAWFKRLAAISLLGVVLRILFGWTATRHFALAEAAVAASGFALLSNFVLLYWRKELRGTGHAVSPWTKEFGQYLLVGAASVGGGYFFTQGDLLVGQRYFAGPELGTYSAAGLLGRALPMVVAPMLTVLFTSRSGHRMVSALRAQLGLLGLYAVGLACGAVGLLVLRGFFVKLIFGKPAPEAAAMVGWFTVTMAFVGLIQALGMWALASRWFKVALLYGGLGLAYWLVLLVFGKTPQLMLRVMPVSAAVAFVVLFIAWLATMRAGSRDDSEGRSSP
jgi:O-antigen/teichoic acid export membrane protein